MTMDSLVGGPTRAHRPSAARAKVTRAPSARGEPLTVVLINYSPDYSYEVPGTNWMPRPDVLPAVDDRGLLVFDDDGDAWLTCWGKEL